MRFCAGLALTLLCSTVSVAQIDFSRYLDESNIPAYSLDEHLEVKFNWDMTGKVQVHMNEGLNYLEEGNLDLAIANFDEVINLDSVFWVSFYYRGISHRKKFSYKEAERDLLAALKLRPTQAEIYVELGEIYQINKKLSKASPLYEKAISLDPNLVQGYFNLGTVEVTRGDPRKALKLFQKCNEVDPDFPDVYIMQGILKFKEKKKNNESIAFFDKAVKSDSSFSQTYFWRGLAYLLLEQNEKCLADWSRFIVFNPGDPFMLTMRGFLNIELNRYDEAFTDLRKAFLSNTLNEEKFDGAQTLLDKQIDLQAATQYLIRNGYGLKEESFGHIKKGYCLLLAGRTKDALENLKKAELLESSATVFFLQAITYEHLDDHPSAYQHYDKALSLDNDIFDAHKKRGIYRVELNDWKAANADFNDMLRLQPQSMVTYRLRGLAKSVQGDFPGAIIDLTKFINSDSTDFESIRTRSVCRAQIGDERGANDDMRKLISLDENNLQLYQDVGKNYLALKDTANAITIFNMFAENYKGLFIPHLELALIFVARKKWDDARKEVDILLKALSTEALPSKYSIALFLDGLIDYHGASYEAAITKFSEALKADKNNLEAKYFRARSYEKTGEKKKSLSDLKDLREKKFRDSEQLYSALQQN